MTIELKPEQQQVIDLAMRTGEFESATEVLDRAFEIIRAQLELGDWMSERRDAISAHIDRGFEQAERGKLIEGDKAIEMLHRRRTEPQL